MKLLHAIALRAILIVVSLTIAEVIIRLAGYSPARLGYLDGFKSVYDPDPMTGWRMRPGVHDTPRVDKSLYRLTIQPDGSRITSSQSPSSIKTPDTDNPIVFIGGSFTLGEELDDQDSMPWLVQERMSQARIYNFGTGGYGGCQGLIRMRELIKENRFRGATFVFTFNEFYELRNVADPAYVMVLARAARSRTAHMPYCLLDEQSKLTIHPPEIYSPLPLVSLFSTARLLEEAITTFRSAQRTKNKREISRAIMLEMEQTAKNTGGKLVILLGEITPEVRADYITFLQQKHMAFVDGFHPSQMDKSMKTVDGHHPNRAMTGFWTSKLVDYFSVAER
jgi:hypothetical protein